MRFQNALGPLRLVAAVTMLVAAMLTAAPVVAQSTIRVLVNDQPITSYDVQARARMLSVFSRGQQGEAEALEQLIDERLMLQEAETRGMIASDAEVEEEFASRAQGANLSPAQFEQALRQAGVDAQTLRSFLRANMSWSALVRARFRSTEEITDQDVAAAMLDREPEAAEGEGGGEQVASYEYMLQPIIFVVPADAPGLEGQRRGEANAFRSGFQGCDGSLQQAQGMPGVVVRPTVRREEASLGPLAETLATMEVGGDHRAAARR